MEVAAGCGGLIPTARCLPALAMELPAFGMSCWSHPHTVPAISRISSYGYGCPPKHQPQAAWGSPGNGHSPPSSPIPQVPLSPSFGISSPHPCPTSHPSLLSPTPNRTGCRTGSSQFNLHGASGTGKKHNDFPFFFFFLGLNLYLGSDLPILPLIPQRLRKAKEGPPPPPAPRERGQEAPIAPGCLEINTPGNSNFSQRGGNTCF